MLLIISGSSIKIVVGLERFSSPALLR